LELLPSGEEASRSCCCQRSRHLGAVVVTGGGILELLLEDLSELLSVSEGRSGSSEDGLGIR
jgi:hypothetical protein